MKVICRVHKCRLIARAGKGARNAAFTVVELLIVVSIILTLAAMAIPFLMSAMHTARVARAVGDIRNLQAEISMFEAMNGRLPDALIELNRGVILDPWGNPYQYLNFSNAKGKGQMRKDRFLVPLNSTFDLYSMGPDGASQPPLTAKSSRDDIVRANDGGFIGIASQY